jgi:hypothetical protein
MIVEWNAAMGAATVPETATHIYSDHELRKDEIAGSPQA